MRGKRLEEHVSGQKKRGKGERRRGKGKEEKKRKGGGGGGEKYLKGKNKLLSSIF